MVSKLLQNVISDKCYNNSHSPVPGTGCVHDDGHSSDSPLLRPPLVSLPDPHDVPECAAAWWSHTCMVFLISKNIIIL